MSFEDYAIKKEQLYKEMTDLTYEVFVNTEYGRMLLDKWKEILTHPVIEMTDTEAVGRTREGRNMFIREILKMIEVHKEIRSSNE